MTEKEYPQTVKWICSKCKGEQFSFQWTLQSYKHEIGLILCHEGWGLQLTDAVVKCCSCGQECDYDEFESEIVNKEDKG